MKTKIISGVLFTTLLTAFISAALITYVYPFLYNLVNQYTNRGEDINIDYWNAYIMVIISSLILYPLCIFIGHKLHK